MKSSNKQSEPDPLTLPLSIKQAVDPTLFSNSSSLMVESFALWIWLEVKNLLIMFHLTREYWSIKVSWLSVNASKLWANRNSLEAFRFLFESLNLQKLWLNSSQMNTQYQWWLLSMRFTVRWVKLRAVWIMLLLPSL